MAGFWDTISGLFGGGEAAKDSNRYTIGKDYAKEYLLKAAKSYQESKLPAHEKIGDDIKKLAEDDAFLKYYFEKNNKLESDRIDGKTERVMDLKAFVTAAKEYYKNEKIAGATGSAEANEDGPHLAAAKALEASFSGRQAWTIGAPAMDPAKKDDSWVGKIADFLPMLAALVMDFPMGLIIGIIGTVAMKMTGMGEKAAGMMGFGPSVKPTEAQVNTVNPDLVRSPGKENAPPGTLKILGTADQIVTATPGDASKTGGELKVGTVMLGGKPHDMFTEFNAEGRSTRLFYVDDKGAKQFIKDGDKDVKLGDGTEIPLLDQHGKAVLDQNGNASKTKQGAIVATLTDGKWKSVLPPQGVAEIGNIIYDTVGGRQVHGYTAAADSGGVPVVPKENTTIPGGSFSSGTAVFGPSPFSRISANNTPVTPPPTATQQNDKLVNSLLISAGLPLINKPSPNNTPVTSPPILTQPTSTTEPTRNASWNSTLEAIRDLPKKINDTMGFDKALKHEEMVAALTRLGTKQSKDGKAIPDSGSPKADALLVKIREFPDNSEDRYIMHCAEDGQLHIVCGTLSACAPSFTPSKIISTQMFVDPNLVENTGLFYTAVKDVTPANENPITLDENGRVTKDTLPNLQATIGGEKTDIEKDLEKLEKGEWLTPDMANLPAPPKPVPLQDRGAAV